MSAQTQKALLDAALRLFAQKGYAMTSMQELADEADVTKGAFYHHFAGKEDLLKRIHDDITTSIIEVLRPIAEAGFPPRERFRALMLAHVGAIESKGDAIFIVLRELRSFSEGNWKAVRAQRGAVEAFYVDTIVAGQREGVFRTDVDARLMAFGVLGMLASMSEWYRPGKVPIRDIARMYTDTLLSGLALDR
jgi:AcrR family transcriptional regulator